MNQSVIKALGLLDYFTDEHPEWSLKGLASEADMPKPTAYRLLTTLERLNYLYKIKEGKHDSSYRLGLRLLELGQLVSEQLEVREISLPYMKELGKEINEVIHLVILNQGMATYIEKVDSTRPLRLYTKIGKSIPPYIGAGPKMLLAHLSKEEQSNILQGELYQLTDSKPIDINKLKKELTEIKRTDFAYSSEEQDQDTIGVAYPVYDFQNVVIASLSVSGLSNHFKDEKLVEIKRKTRATAEQISLQMGHQRGKRY